MADVRETDGDRRLDIFDPGLARADPTLSEQLEGLDLNSERANGKIPHGPRKLTALQGSPSR